MSRKAWESTNVVANDSFLTASGTTAGDSDDEDFCFRLLFRYHSAQAAGDYVISKYTGSIGWALVSNLGAWQLHIHNTALATLSIVDVAMDDGAWHWVTAWYDKSADIVYCKTDMVAEVSKDTSAVTGSLTNAQAFLINKLAPVGNAGNPGMQIGAAGVCVGANSQAMYDAAEADSPLPGKDPGAVDADKTALTTTSRASLVSHEVAPGYVGHFSGGTTPATCQLPITHSPALEGGAGGLGLYCNSAVVNLVPNSRTSGSATGATTNTDNAVDAADGFRAASTHLATASPDFVGKTEVVIAETDYVGSVFLKEVTVGVEGRVYAYDLTGSVEISGAVAFTADDTWAQRIEVPFTTPSSCVSVSFRVEITNDTETVATDFWQVELGTIGAGAIINTSGGSAALVESNYRGTNAVPGPTGRLECTYVPAVDRAAVGYLFGSIGTVDRKAVYLSNVMAARTFVGFDSTLVLNNNLVKSGITVDVEHAILVRWDDDAGDFPENSALTVTVDADASQVSSTTTGTALNDLNDIVIGAFRTAGSGFNGWISRLVTHDGPGAAP